MTIIEKISSVRNIILSCGLNAGVGVRARARARAHTLGLLRVNERRVKPTVSRVIVKCSLLVI